MAAVPVAELTKEQKDELVCVYSALILHDDKADITASALNSIISASGNQVEAYWPTMFARVAEGMDLGDFLKVGGGGAAAGGAAAAAPAAGAAAEDAAPAVEEEEEEEEMDFDLFG